VYHIGYRDESERFGHAFNTYDEPGTGLKRIFIYVASAEYTEVYLVALDGRLQRAAAKNGSEAKGTAVWSNLPLGPAIPGLKGELDYWRRQQHVLAKEPDRN
jgi:hypothetical protein